MLNIRKVVLPLIFLSWLMPSLAFCDVSLYLPLKLAPELETKVERLFVLANMPIIKRPIPIAELQIALERVGDKNPELAYSVRRYLNRYAKKIGATHFQTTLAGSSREGVSLANVRGETSESHYSGSFIGHWAPTTWLIANAGGLAFDGAEQQKDSFAEHTFLSLGTSAMQIDIGYRPHWFGPFQESDMLISTHAASLPAITFSNNLPLEFLGLRYEVFLAAMSKSNKILSEDGLRSVSGYPRLMGLHLSIEPFSGFAIGVNRLLQYGGGDRDSSPSALARAFFNPKDSDNRFIEADGDVVGENFGNQLMSITTRYTFVGDFPMSAYMTYAGEDTSSSGAAALGNTAMMLGLHFPLLTPNLDLTYEYASWQNGWYVNGVFGDGLTNYATVMGHWAASHRDFADALGATSHMAKLTWSLDRDQSFLFKFRRVENESYSSNQYEIGNELSVEYTRPWNGFIIGTSVLSGNNVLGESHSRMTGFIRW